VIFLLLLSIVLGLDVHNIYFFDIVFLSKTVSCHNSGVESAMTSLYSSSAVGYDTDTAPLILKEIFAAASVVSETSLMF
jgi:hypothetical protein